MSDFEQRLESLWQQGGREVALSFLRRAVRGEMSLSELLAALRFEQVAGHLNSIRLHEVVGPQAPRQPTVPGQPPQARNDALSAQPVKRTRRKRRSGDELRVIHQALIDMLREEPGSLSTTQMVQALGEQGHEFDTVRINVFLRQLEEKKYVADLGGKPKSWRATQLLRSRDAESKVETDEDAPEEGDVDGNA